MTLAERAKNLRGIRSPLMEDREKLETRDATGRELTLKAVDFIAGVSANPFVVVVFAEEPKKFLFGGKVLTDLMMDLKAQLDGEGLDINDELAKENFKIRMSPKRSKNGFWYTDVEVM